MWAMLEDKNTTTQPKSEKESTHQPNKLITKLKQHKRVVIGAAVALLLLGGIYFWTNQPQPSNTSNTSTQPNPTSSQNASNTNQSAFVQQYGQGCKERKNVNFTSLPMKLDDIGYIRPLGAMSDGHVTPTDHIYISPVNPNAPDNAYPVLMPADGTITKIAAMPSQYIGDREGQKTASEDHNIVISHSCRYFSNYIHINKLSERLVNAVGALQPNDQKMTSIDLKAGDVIGYIGRNSFDWIAIDADSTLKGFISPELYVGESWKIHTANPFDWYKEPLRSQIEAKSMRFAAPRGGKIDYDQAGKLIGNWFKEGSGGYSTTNSDGGRYWDGHLSVVPDSIDPTSTIVSIGNWTGSAAQYVVSGKVDPAAVSTGTGAVKYELKKITYETASGQPAQFGKLEPLVLSQNTSVEGTIMFQVLDGEKLKVEKFPGKTASKVSGFTAAAQTYER